jgi:hypothetical protein
MVLIKGEKPYIESTIDDIDTNLFTADLWKIFIRTCIKGGPHTSIEAHV